MNRQQTLAIVLGSIVAFGMTSGVALGAAATTASDESAATSSDDLAALQDGEPNDAAQDNETTQTPQGTQTTQGGQQNQTIPITQALETAANETNGTVVGAQLGQQDGGLLGDGGDLVYTVDALTDNGTHFEAQINATNGSVVQVQQPDDGFLQGIFGENNVPEDPINLSAIYNATEAVQLVQNESNVNGTVTQVTLDQRDGDFVYQVQVNGTDGQQSTVVVDAMKDGEGIIEVQGAGAGTTTTPQNGTQTETEAGGNES